MRAAIAGVCLIFCVNIAEAQTISGKIFGNGPTEKEILPGATVKWIGAKKGTVSNENGVFNLDKAGISDLRLITSFSGFETDTLAVEEKTYFSITLQPISTRVDDVTVTGSRPNAYISSYNAIKTEVITQKELTKAACCDLAGCFETQATIQPQTTNVITNSKELRILGLSGVYNQILFDGMPMIQGLAYTYGISSYPGTLVNTIFVAKGANSVLQGYESISGQINIIPKMPDKTDKLLLNVYANSFLERHFNANYAASVGKNKKWHTLLTFHAVRPANKADNDQDQFLDLPRLKRYMIYNRWQYGNEQEKGLYTHIGLRFLNEERVGGQESFNPETDKGSNKVYGQTVNYNQPEIYTKTGYRFNDNHAVGLMISAFHQDQKSYFGTLYYKARQATFYANLQHEIVWKGQHLLKYGASFRYQNIEEDISFTDNVLARTYDGHYTTKQVVPGVFAENSFHWFDDKLVWMLGARVDNHQQYGTYFTPRTLLKYNLRPNHTLRGSIGTGWRQVNLFSENINLLASSRDVVFQEDLQPEKAVNWGINYTWQYKMENISGTISADFYQTRFQNQFFPDYDSDPTKAYIRNFTGPSASNAFQIDASLTFRKLLELKASYNFLDVYRVENGTRTVLPFNARNRVMTAISYRPKNNKWYFDVNAHWLDRQRLPVTLSNPVEYRNKPYSDPYILVNGQVTFKASPFEFYAGVENIFNFRQKQPIISWQDPFSRYFDTSSVWGPTRGREIYAGVRWTLR